ncbi:MAG: hypothetical protein CM15mV41_0070 [Caudoviricetes sp.]|nr:MAG: hypothetical protein CM15mV41_0070 [Caudoviricetes sp.]
MYRNHRRSTDPCSLLWGSDDRGYIRLRGAQYLLEIDTSSPFS